MTLDAGFMVITAINEMLLKSWGRILRVFEGIPTSWHNVCLSNLRAEGGISVSASLTNGNLDWIALCPDVDCECQIKNHFHIGLKVFERKTEEILTEVAADQIFFSVSLEAGKTYLILPRLSHPKLS